jgi:hypothetical protein
MKQFLCVSLTQFAQPTFADIQRDPLRVSIESQPITFKKSLGYRTIFQSVPYHFRLFWPFSFDAAMRQLSERYAK